MPFMLGSGTLRKLLARGGQNKDKGGRCGVFKTSSKDEIGAEHVGVS